MSANRPCLMRLRRQQRRRRPIIRFARSSRMSAASPCPMSGSTSCAAIGAIGQDHPDPAGIRRYRRAGARRGTRRRARQPVPRPYPRGRCDHPCAALLRGRRRHACRRLGRSHPRCRNGRNRTDACRSRQPRKAPLPTRRRKPRPATRKPRAIDGDGAGDRGIAGRQARRAICCPALVPKRTKFCASCSWSLRSRCFMSPMSAKTMLPRAMPCRKKSRREPRPRARRRCYRRRNRIRSRRSGKRGREERISRLHSAWKSRGLTKSSAPGIAASISHLFHGGAEGSAGLDGSPRASAPQAAGVIHTDFERGFIKAETIAYADYIACNGEAGAREAGKLRQEGKEYIVQDGDMFHFRFNV